MAKIVKLCTILFLPLSFMAYSNEKSPPPYIQYSNEIITSFVQEMKEKHGLVCIGSGGGFAQKVHEIEVVFIAYQHSSLEEARRLEIEATETLVTKVNQCEKIRPYLKEYPFSATNAAVSISFRQKDNGRFNDGSIAHVFQAKNKIFYRTSEDEKLKPFTEEPYDVALKIVKEKR